MATKAAKKGFSVARRYAMDTATEVKGLWFDFEDGARLQVARYGNPEHVKLERQLEAEYAAKLESKDREVQTEARTELNRRVFAHTLLKDWEGILDENEKELPYSVEAAEQLLEFPEFFGAVLEFATQVEKFRKYKQDAAVKN